MSKIQDFPMNFRGLGEKCFFLSLVKLLILNLYNFSMEEKKWGG